MLNKHVKSLEYYKDAGKVYVNEKYSIDIEDGSIDDLSNVVRDDPLDYPQWLFELRNDLRDIGLVK